MSKPTFHLIEAHGSTTQTTNSEREILLHASNIFSLDFLRLKNGTHPNTVVINDVIMTTAPKISQFTKKNTQ